jgi:translation initiation factor eIF-2B subunit beta
LETAALLRTVVCNSRWSTAASLLQLVRDDVAVRIIKAQPIEFAVGNIVRRVLHLIREEYRSNLNETSATTTTGTGSAPLGTAASSASAGPNSAADVRTSALGRIAEEISRSSSPLDDDLSFAAFKQQSSTSLGSHSSGSAVVLGGAIGRSLTDSSMYNLLADKGAEAIDYSRPLFALKQLVIQGLNELIDELETVESSIAAQSLEYIHNNEVIMTIGKSNTVEQFLKAAARKRQFQVIVAEAAPGYGGHIMAKNLSAAGIETLLIPDSAVYALMARVNKVIIGCHAVTANGGLIAMAGSEMVAVSARHYAIPVCIVTGLYKLSPISPENHDAFNLFGPPDSVLSFSESDLISSVQVVNPCFDYVPPQHVSIFVTNVGGHPPSYIYRLLGELYDQEDYKLY